MLKSDEWKMEKAEIKPKGWGIHGHEQNAGEIFVYHESDKDNPSIKIQTIKSLNFGKDKKLSLHFHKDKAEFFCVVFGSIKIEIIDHIAGIKEEKIMGAGDRIFVPPLTPHRMTGLDDINILIEVSTEDKKEDSYRIERGD